VYTILGGIKSVTSGIRKRGFNIYLSYRCPCQIPAHEIIYNPEALDYFMINMILRGSKPALARLMDS